MRIGNMCAFLLFFAEVWLLVLLGMPKASGLAFEYD